MNDTYPAFDVSPVPVPALDAVPPPLFRGLYGMPAFVTIPTGDLAASVRFWTEGLGFFELFAIPGRMVHLRRWMFQDVLLVAGPSAEQVPATTVSFACVIGQVDDIAQACRALDPDCATGPQDTPWNTRDVEVTTPERARVVFTAGRPYDPASEEARALADIGIGRSDAAARSGEEDRD